MPIGKPHKSRFKKNLVVLAIVFGIVALIYMITLIKMSGG